MQEAQDAAGQADAVEGELAAGAAPDEGPSAVQEAAPPPEDGVSGGVAMGPAQVLPPYYGLSPLAGSPASFVAWVADAVKAIGPQQMEQVVMLYRLGGVVPPNINKALAHLQELLRLFNGHEARWLKVLQDLDRLSSY